ncbi:membrane steroid-binding protein 1-like [Panicum miliaceum]|uniref:Membrane steroid-binding protein 1-like n=1 Tax=Panicum miliaceum TaxID=4540 RepID=A0A3L6TUQ9_PANMI|nr:membrane steroid-binding protein 1-like [Panicum miliaceum]
MASCSVFTPPALSASADGARPRPYVSPVFAAAASRPAACGVALGRAASRSRRSNLRGNLTGFARWVRAAVVAELWAAAKDAPPLAVLASVAVAVAIYKVGSSLLAPRPPPPRRVETQTAPPPPVPEPVQVGEITEEELRQYDGSDPEKPLLMAIKGQIYDVSQSRLLPLIPSTLNLQFFIHPAATLLCFAVVVYGCCI